jgi:hypothetical protein
LQKNADRVVKMGISIDESKPEVQRWDGLAFVPSFVKVFGSYWGWGRCSGDRATGVIIPYINCFLM